MSILGNTLKDSNAPALDAVSDDFIDIFYSSLDKNLSDMNKNKSKIATKIKEKASKKKEAGKDTIKEAAKKAGKKAVKKVADATKDQKSSTEKKTDSQKKNDVKSVTEKKDTFTSIANTIGMMTTDISNDGKSAGLTSGLLEAALNGVKDELLQAKEKYYATDEFAQNMLKYDPTYVQNIKISGAVLDGIGKGLQSIGQMLAGMELQNDHSLAYSAFKDFQNVQTTKKQTQAESNTKTQDMVAIKQHQASAENSMQLG